MELDIFKDHPEHRIPAGQIREELHKLKQAGHLDDRQYRTLEGGLEAITHASDHSVTGRDLYDWLHNVSTLHGDHISADKVHDRLAPAFAGLIKRS